MCLARATTWNNNALLLSVVSSTARVNPRYLPQLCVCARACINPHPERRLVNFNVTPRARLSLFRWRAGEWALCFVLGALQFSLSLSLSLGRSKSVASTWAPIQSSSGIRVSDVRHSGMIRSGETDRDTRLVASLTREIPIRAGIAVGVIPAMTESGSGTLYGPPVFICQTTHGGKEGGGTEEKGARINREGIHTGILATEDRERERFGRDCISAGLSSHRNRRQSPSLRGKKRGKRAAAREMPFGPRRSVSLPSTR